MPVVPLRIPPGAYRNGTEYQAKGRWRDVNLVRWHEGAMQPVGGLEDPTNLGSGTNVLSDYVRSAISWVNAAGTTYVAYGNHDSVFTTSNASTIVNVTPSVTTSGDEDTEPDSWHFALLGETLLMCHTVDGKIWELGSAYNSTASQVSNSPTSCFGVFVSPENFVFALGDGGDARSVRWSGRGDRTVWTAADTNQAGSFTLDTDGQILFARKVRGGFIIVTTHDVWRATYIGYPDVYRFDQEGQCTAVGAHCGVTAGGIAYWMGENAFWMYRSGVVDTIPCDVSDYVFGRIDRTRAWKTNAWHNKRFGEVWWLYESDSSTDDIDSYVAYNYREGTWHYGSYSATTVVPVDGAWSTGGHAAAVGFFSPTPSNIVTNGTFDTDTDWTKGSGWSIGSGVASNGSGSGSALEQGLTGLNVGQPYSIVFDITVATSASFTVNPGIVGYSVGAGSSTLVQTFVASAATDTLQFILNSGDLEIDNVVLGPATFMLVDMPDSQVHLTTPYAKTGPFELGDGERRVHVTKLYPDEQDAGELKYTFGHREYPTATETTESAVTAANPTDLRFSGRQFTMKVEAATANTDWRCGVQRLEIKPGGKR